MKNENPALLKWLRQYSALAAPMLATAGVTNAQVIYTDINPDATLSLPGDSLLLDLNNDGIFDYTFRLVAYTTDWNRACVAPANVSGVYTTLAKNAIIGYHNVGTGGTVYPYVSELFPGHPIDNNQQWLVVHDILYTYQGSNVFEFPALNSVFYTAHYGQWQDGVDHYVGFRFTPDNDTTLFYGWARCLVSNDSKMLTIKDFAYQSEAGVAIAAGEGMNIGINMPENNDGVEIYSSDNVLQVNFKTMNLSDTYIRLRNILGQEIISQKVATSQNTIRLNQLSKGTYIVQVSFDGKEVSKKIIVH